MAELSKKYGIKVFKLTLWFNGKRFPIHAHFGNGLHKLDVCSPSSNLTLAYLPPDDCSKLDAALSSMMGKALEGAGEIRVVSDTLSSALAEASTPVVGKKSEIGDDTFGALMAIRDIFATGSFMLSGGSEGMELLALESPPADALRDESLPGPDAAAEGPPGGTAGEGGGREAGKEAPEQSRPSTALEGADSDGAWASTLRWLEVSLADVPGRIAMQFEDVLLARLDNDKAPLLRGQAYGLGVALNMSMSSFVSQLEGLRRQHGKLGAASFRRSAYEVLGCKPDCSEDELKDAYKAAVLRTHPDKGGDAAEFLEVREAWKKVVQDRPEFKPPSDGADEAASPQEQARPGGSTAMALEGRLKAVLEDMEDCVQVLMAAIKVHQSEYHGDVAFCLSYDDVSPVQDWVNAIHCNFSGEDTSLAKRITSCSGALWHAAASEKCLYGDTLLRELSTEEVAFSVAVRDMLPELEHAGHIARRCLDPEAEAVRPPPPEPCADPGAEGTAGAAPHRCVDTLLADLKTVMSTITGHLDDMLMSLWGLEAVCRRLRSVVDPAPPEGAPEKSQREAAPKKSPARASGCHDAGGVPPEQERRLVECLRTTARRCYVFERQKLRRSPPPFVKDRLFELLRANCSQQRETPMQLPTTSRWVVYCDPRLTLLRMCVRLDRAAALEVLRSTGAGGGEEPWRLVSEEWEAAR